MNETETSLHPDLVPPLARWIAKVAQRSQVWVVTHSDRLAAALKAVPEAEPIHLVKELGATQVLDQGLLERAPWQWLAR